MITREKKLAYLAGVIDSDGSISISKSYLQRKEYRCPRFVLEITVTNTNEDMMKWLINNFEGSYHKRKIPTNFSKIDGRIIKSKRIIYGWKVTSKRALPILKEIEIYLIAKKRQAQLAIEFQENIFNRDTVSVKAGKGISHYLSNKEIEKRTWYSETIKNLNLGKISLAETKRSDTLTRVKR